MTVAAKRKNIPEAVGSHLCSAVKLNSRFVREKAVRLHSDYYSFTRVHTGTNVTLFSLHYILYIYTVYPLPNLPTLVFKSYELLRYQWRYCFFSLHVR